MNRVDSTSDSDSNTSSSWVFVDHYAPHDDVENNKYYLNCSSEPVQELSQYYSSTSLEQETDSDGISVISESDAEENVPNEGVPVLENIENVPIRDSSQKLHEVEVKGGFYFNKFVIIGWVFISVVAPLLLNYISNYAEEVLGNYQDNTVVEINPDLLITEQGIDVMMRKMLDNNIYDRSKMDRKRKHDSKGEVDLHRPDCKERYCDQKRSHNLERKKNDENYKKGEFTKDELYDFRNRLTFMKNDLHRAKELDNVGDWENKHKFSQKANITGKNDCLANKNRKSKSAIKKDTTIDYDVWNNSKQKQKRSPNENLSNSDNTNLGDPLLIQNQKYKSRDTNKHKKLPHEAKSERFREKENRKNQKKKEFDFKQNKKQQKKETSKKRRNINDVQKLKNLLDEKDKNIRELTKAVRAKDKHLKILEKKILRELTLLRKFKVEKSNQKNVEKIYNKINNTSGEWYYQLYKGRSKFRKQQHASDWVFDRANFRNGKRNFKNNWYWNWMSDREQLRLKRGFWQFTY